MVDLQQESIAPTTVNMSTKKKELLSTAMKRTSEWSALPTSLFSFFLSFFLLVIFLLYIEFLFLNLNGNTEDGTLYMYRIFSQEIPSDVTVHSGGASFSLHKVELNLDLTFQFHTLDGITNCHEFMRWVAIFPSLISSNKVPQRILNSFSANYLGSSIASSHFLFAFFLPEQNWMKANWCLELNCDSDHGHIHNLISHSLLNLLAVSTSFKVWVHKESGIRVY